MTKRGLLAVALLAACDADPGLLDEGAEDSALSSSAVTISVPTTNIPSEQDETPVLATVRLHAGPSQPRSFLGRFVVSLPTDAPEGKLMAAGGLACYSATTGERHSYVWTTQNIRVQGIQVTLIARLLFAPADEDDYDCKLLGSVGKYHGGAGKTELIYSSPTWIKKWGTGNDSKHAAYAEGSNDYVAATHIHGGITTLATDGTLIGNAEYVVKGNSFHLPAGPTSFNAIAGIHMTSCFRGPGDRVDTSCFPGARSQGDPPASSTSVVDLSIIVSQLHADGRVCVQDPGPVKRVTIQGNSHHQTANLVLNDIPVHPCGGSRRFSIKVLATRVSGNPVRIERGDLSPDDPTRFTGYTHAGVYY